MDRLEHLAAGQQRVADHLAKLDRRLAVNETKTIGIHSITSIIVSGAIGLVFWILKG
jgi:hypothetical protein